VLNQLFNGTSDEWMTLRGHRYFARSGFRGGIEEMRSSQEHLQLGVALRHTAFEGEKPPISGSLIE